MKIILRPNCCKDGHDLIKWMTAKAADDDHDGFYLSIHTGYPDPIYYQVRYCPFCGQAISYPIGSGVDKPDTILPVKDCCAQCGAETGSDTGFMLTPVCVECTAVIAQVFDDNCISVFTDAEKIHIRTVTKARSTKWRLDHRTEPPAIRKHAHRVFGVPLVPKTD